MKITKNLSDILFHKVIGLKGELYLSVAAGTFFDLHDPSHIETEIDMWKLVAATMGKHAILDEGNPKATGEFLAFGSCWSTGGVLATHLNPRISIGNLRKTLTVFGDRVWLPQKSDAPTLISEATPFISMPTDATRSFGGVGYPINPKGRGFRPFPPSQIWQLPNVEGPTKIKTFLEEPLPVHFGMLGVMDPRRHKNLGTYDSKWLDSRWPFYPDDFDPAFFNCAMEDQRKTAGFFVPGEKIIIEHMHPDFPLIESTLPLSNHRAFIKQLKEGEEQFCEAQLQLDTVWLWPEKMRGLVLARGMFPIYDDEASDVTHLYLTRENPLITHKSKEECLIDLEQRLKRKLKIDLNELSVELAEKANKTENLKDNIRRKLEDIRSQPFFDKPSNLKPYTIDSILEEIQNYQTSIKAMMIDPKPGAAEKITLLRRMITAKNQVHQKMLAHGETDSDFELGNAFNDQINNVDCLSKNSLAEIRKAAARLEISNPDKYKSLIAEIDMIEHSGSKKEFSQDSNVSVTVNANMEALTPFQRIESHLSRFQREKNVLLKKIETIDQNKTRETEALHEKLESIDEAIDSLESMAVELRQADEKRNILLDTFISQLKDNSD